jgi:predicted transcriptional regulator
MNAQDESTEPVTIDLTDSTPVGVMNPCDYTGCKNHAVRVTWRNGEQFDVCEEHL